ncbi:hypothetical protein [Prochlorococcus sp. MIT 1307]|uniref:hypothetical protein n=1 Tax=Prochlorococcus sp. MIT 1307 TaxID=3096219 RepID=UPI002A74C207|nr:hypothetical protein [Prochlorococcus sp. MIT 1307]
MDRKKFASKFLSIIEKLELFYNSLNKNLNTNKLSIKFESLVRKKIRISEVLNLERLRVKVISLRRKKFKLPTYLTADSFSEGLRLFVTSKFAGASQTGISKVNEKGETSRRKDNKQNPALGEQENFKVSALKSKKSSFKSKLPHLSGININKYSRNIQKSIENILNKFLNNNNTKILSSNFFNSLLFKSSNFKKIFKRFAINNSLINQKQLGKTVRIDKNSQTIGVAVYSDHLLTVANISINANNQIVVRGLVEVPIQGSIIGDSLVEDINELADIVLDLIGLLKIDKSPLLVILSSSFFKVHTFYSSELKQISNTDYKVQSKSPYLPNDTFVEFSRMSRKTDKNKLVRTIYARRKSIESWTNMLEIINSPIIGLTPAAPHVFDKLTNKLSDRLTILIDIEITSTSVLIGRKSADLTSHLLPYGCSLYLSQDNENLSENYFARVLSSIQLIMSERDEALPSYIFVIGHGLDNLIRKDNLLPKMFKRASEMNIADYTYNPKRMDIHELNSKSIHSTIDTLSSVLSSCL